MCVVLCCVCVCACVRALENQCGMREKFIIVLLFSSQLVQHFTIHCLVGLPNVCRLKSRLINDPSRTLETRKCFTGELHRLKLEMQTNHVYKKTGLHAMQTGKSGDKSSFAPEKTGVCRCEGKAVSLQRKPVCVDAREKQFRSRENRCV